MQVTQNEQIAVVQAYIFHRTGKEIEINTNQFVDIINVFKLNQAYAIATTWFRNNNGSVNYYNPQ